MDATQLGELQDLLGAEYASGGSSGPGSYGRLAAGKADFLNRFVEDHQIKTVLEIGCGDGNQLSLA